MSSYYLQIIRKSTKCLYSAGKKNETNTILHILYKGNSWGITGPNVKYKTVKRIEENTGGFVILG